jgi:diaminopimelate decarboxylase
MKSQPVRKLLKKWCEAGNGIEVVSEFEFRAALKEGFEPERILVNGVAKHSWLGDAQALGLRVHFDSLHEIRELARLAKSRRWRVGVRCRVNAQIDPDEPSYVGQFGMSRNDVKCAVSELADAGLTIESVHFHLRSNVPNVGEYARAIGDLAEICQEAGVAPQYVDCGGGLACPGNQWPRSTGFFEIDEFSRVLSEGIAKIRSAEEIWLENGRFLSGRAGALVLRVLDIKHGCDCRYLICDGGRTNHALVSDWERHKLEVVPDRKGPTCLTTICGPTCMAFDRLCRSDLPTDIRIGDLVIWYNAGAYHIPWETRFSHGLAAVVWIDRGDMGLARRRETFEEWWNLWS